MNEKHPTNDNPSVSKSAPKLVPVEQASQDQLSCMMKDSMSPDDWRKYLYYMMQHDLHKLDLSIVSPENLVSYFWFVRFCTDEKSIFDVYSLIRTILEKKLAVDIRTYAKLDDPDCRELMYKLKDYMESFKEYIKRLNDRLKAISALADAIDLIDNPATKQIVTEKCNDVIDIHDALFYFYNSLEELRLKLEIEKLKYTQKKSNSPDVLSDKINEIVGFMPALGEALTLLAQNTLKQKEKLEQWEGEYPEGLRALGEIAYKGMSEKIGDILIRLNKAGIKGIDEDIFYARFIYNHSLTQIAADLAEKRKWKRDRSTISRHIAEIRIRLKNAKINSNMILEIKKSAKIE